MKIDLKKVGRASATLANLSENKRDIFLGNLSTLIKKRKQQIIEANNIDIVNAKKNKLTQAFIQRLILDSSAIDNMQKRVKELKKLKSGIGEIIENNKNKDGLVLQKVRVPLGVLLVIYESRPEVTIDVVALCIKSGNAVILKGGSEAKHTNKILYRCIETALKRTGLRKETISIISSRNETKQILTKNNNIDLVIARGSYEMVKSVLNNSTIPVLAHAAGGARIFVDKSANLKMAEKIILNAKTSKPSACNALDTIILHKDISEKLLQRIIPLLKSHNIKVVKNNWNTEFLGPYISIKTVKNVVEASEFINKYTKKHSEGIIAEEKSVIQYFTDTIDCAAVFVNCSTRLHDGYVFGLGAEMGIATGKLHARGPVGLKELTTYKWKIYGKGQIRK